MKLNFISVSKTCYFSYDSYVAVGLEKYPEYKSEKYDAIETLNKVRV